MMRIRGIELSAFGAAWLMTVAVFGSAFAADDPKQKVDAGGVVFHAPAGWKSVTPSSQMRRAELRVEPLEGDGYPAEMVVYAFPGGAGSVEANLERWQKLFKDKDGKPPKIESKKVQGKNVEVTRAETAGHYFPAQFGPRREPDRPGARLLGAIVMTDQASYYLRMVGPDKTMTKLRPAFDELLSTIEVEGK
jgi:hypothetical protein